MRSLFFGCLVFLSSVYASSTAQEEYSYLDNIALASDPNQSSGKGSNKHNYTEIYAKYLGPIKNNHLKFLEIGIFEANGVKLWENYFPNAELHFVDITFEKVKYFSNRSVYHLADQANVSQLNAIINKTGSNFDIIIDDGGHTMVQQITSLCTLFPHVKSGGLYIIEDTHTSYWQTYGGNGTYDKPKAGPNTCIGFLKKLIDDVNYVGARTLIADHNKITPELDKELSYFQRNIYSMHFYDSLCIIIKR